LEVVPAMRATNREGCAHETENKARLGLPRIIQRKENAPEFDYSSFYVTTGMGHTDCLVAQDLALLTKVRTLIHEEISLLTVLYFPFRAVTPGRASVGLEAGSQLKSQCKWLGVGGTFRGTLRTLVGI
jgi:hypothetical protein